MNNLLLGKWIENNITLLSNDVMTHYTYSSYKTNIQTDTNYTLRYLADSLILNSPNSFVQYMDWLRSIIVTINLKEFGLLKSLDYIYEALLKHFSPDELKDILDLFDQIKLRFTRSFEEEHSYFDLDSHYGQVAFDYLSALLDGNRSKAAEIIDRLIQSKTPIKDIYLSVFQASQYEVGRLWQYQKISVAQEHYCTASTQLIMAKLYPLIFRVERRPGKIVAACVGTELHELGIRMVTDFLELEGFDTYYLGANTPNKFIIQTLVKEKADILILSTTMLSHVSQIKDIIDDIHTCDDLSHIKVMVGGYPFNQDNSLVKTVQADLYSIDANQAVKNVLELLYE